MSVSCQYPMRLFGVGMACNDRIALIVVGKWFEFYTFLNMRKSLFFLNSFFHHTCRLGFPYISEGLLTAGYIFHSWVGPAPRARKG